MDAPWGTGLEFDGVDDRLAADGVAAAGPAAHGFAFGAWVRPRSVHCGAVLAFHAANGDERSRILVWIDTLAYSDHLIGLQRGLHHDADLWYHVLVSIDEDGDGVLYVNGQPEKTSNRRQARPQRRSSALAQSCTVRLIRWSYTTARSRPPRSMPFTPTPLWMIGGRSDFVNVELSVPAELDGLYQLNLRPADVFSNSARRANWPAWTGEIDTRAPLVDISAAEKVSRLSIKTTYTCRAQDFNLYVRRDPNDGFPPL